MSNQQIDVFKRANLVLAGIPIGRDDDAPPSLRQALTQADLIAAEDTRRLLNLAGRLGVELHAKVTPFHEHNEDDRAEYLLGAASAGRKVLVVSDAGMPTIADPGYKLVAAAAAAGVALTVLPGPSAVLTGLALSGLPTDRFCFEGFVPRKDSERRKFFEAIRGKARTCVCFDSPRRVAQSLKIAREILGEDRRAVLCRELTKTHEEVIRGTLSELVEATAGEVLGEVTLVIAGAPKTSEAGTQIDAVSLVKALMEQGISVKDATKAVAKATGASKKSLYEAAIETGHTNDLDYTLR